MQAGLSVYGQRHGTLQAEVCVLQPLHEFLEDRPTHSSHDITWAAGIDYRLHFFQCGEFDVWGLTAGILIAVAKLAFDRNPDFEEACPGTRPFTHIWYDGTKVAYRD